MTKRRSRKRKRRSRDPLAQMNRDISEMGKTLVDVSAGITVISTVSAVARQLRSS